MVFESRSHARRGILRAAAWMVALAAALMLAGLLAGWLVTPSSRAAKERVLARCLASANHDAVDFAHPQEAAIPRAAQTSERERMENRAAFAVKKQIRTAFVVAEDEKSVLDYRRHRGVLDAAFVTWFSVTTKDGMPVRLPSTEPAESFFGTDAVALPVVTNADSGGGWRPQELAELLGDETASARLIENLKQQVLALRADGINVDFEQFTKNERDDFSFFIRRLAEAFHHEHLLVTVDVPLYDEAYDYEYLGDVADALVLMAYDEHYPGSAPGSIAGEDWFTNALDEMAARIPPQKLIVVLGAYGYDWNLASTPGKPAASVPFADAMRLAEEADGGVTADGDAMNTHFRYRDEHGDTHEVWLLDAVSAWNQMNIAAGFRLHGTSMWRLGLEDEGVWDFMGLQDPASFQPARLRTVRPGALVTFRGDGELLHVATSAAEGTRQIDLHGRLVDYAEYLSMPRSSEVVRFGHDPRKRIALTFDDGPDPEWTPPILDVLREENVSATFFVIGDEVQRFPALTRRISADGHALGNHSFMHPRLEDVSATRLRIELNATARAIQAATGRGTVLFRAPFDTDTRPARASELRVIAAAGQLGCICVGADIDACDYEKPGTNAIVKHVLDGLAPGGPNIVVMHDGGGDRSQTVAALRRLVPLLKTQGYEFVTVPALMHVSPDEVMPPLTREDQWVVLGQKTLTSLRNGGWRILYWVFIATTVISVLRIAFVGLLVWRHHGKKTAQSPFTPPVTVLVPAFNEAGVIIPTLEAVLRSDYPDFTVLVIDDGSTDATATLVGEFAARHPRVRLLTKANAGKWAALNDGFRATDTEYVVTIDADTLIGHHTLRELMRPFAEERVDAVCGNVQVGNVRNLLTAFQDVEYVTTQNYDRRAFSVLNCISVVPGATGAWRRASVLAAGGYSNQTLTEDADLTLAMLARGARIVYAPEARSNTEAPATHTALFKQRLRWSFGTFQCLWKHRRRFTAGTTEWVALGNLFCFQLVYPLLAPLGDAEFAISLWQGNYGVGLVSYSLFLMLDVIASVVGFRLDRRSPRSLWTLLIQRFYYRQFMYLVAFAAVRRAIRGRREPWNKLRREGTASAVLEEYPATPVGGADAETLS